MLQKEYETSNKIFITITVKINLVKEGLCIKEKVQVIDDYTDSKVRVGLEYCHIFTTAQCQLYLIR